MSFVIGNSAAPGSTTGQTVVDSGRSFAEEAAAIGRLVHQFVLEELSTAQTKAVAGAAGVVTIIIFKAGKAFNFVATTFGADETNLAELQAFLVERGILPKPGEPVFGTIILEDKWNQTGQNRAIPFELVATAPSQAGIPGPYVDP